MQEQIPLHAAVCRGQRFSVRQLLLGGCDPNIIDDQGETALIKSATAGNLHLVAELLLHKADPRQPDCDGRIPRNVASCPLVRAAIDVFSGRADLEESSELLDVLTGEAKAAAETAIRQQMLTQERRRLAGLGLSDPGACLVHPCDSPSAHDGFWCGEDGALIAKICGEWLWPVGHPRQRVVAKADGDVITINWFGTEIECRLRKGGTALIFSDGDVWSRHPNCFATMSQATAKRHPEIDAQKGQRSVEKRFEPESQTVLIQVDSRASQADPNAPDNAVPRITKAPPSPARVILRNAYWRCAQNLVFQTHQRSGLSRDAPVVEIKWTTDYLELEGQDPIACVSADWSRHLVGNEGELSAESPVCFDASNSHGKRAWGCKAHGSLVVALRGEVEFETIARRAERSGAVGVVIIDGSAPWTSEWEMTLNEPRALPPAVPAVLVPRQVGHILCDMSDSGLKARLVRRARRGGGRSRAAMQMQYMRIRGVQVRARMAGVNSNVAL